MHARGSLQWIDHPELGRVVLPHSPLVFEGTPRRPIEPSLPLGASNDEVFGEWLGHSAGGARGFEGRRRHLVSQCAGSGRRLIAIDMGGNT